jgi:hypothetical protein
MPPPAIRLGPPQPYLKTHGGKVARLHRFDWAVLLLLVAADVGLNLIEPFHRFVGEDMLTDLRYPLKSNTVPIWAVPMYAVIGPIIVFVGVYLKRRNVYDMHHAILGLLFSVLITGVLTDAIKDGVGRAAPVAAFDIYFKYMGLYSGWFAGVFAELCGSGGLLELSLVNAKFRECYNLPRP